MVGKWRMTANCYRCGISIEEISPDEMLISSDRKEMVICPGCGEILYVTGSGDDMDTSRMLHYDGKPDKAAVQEFLGQQKAEGNRNAIMILHEISKIRVKLNYGPLNL